jgi:hypothetical protein
MLFEGSLPPADREPYYRAYSDPADRTAGYEYYRAFAADAEDNRAHAVSKRLLMPVLAMGGQRSLGSTIAASFRPVAADVREVVAPDSAHFIPEENPRFLIDCARLFFGDLPAGTPPARPRTRRMRAVNEEQEQSLSDVDALASVLAKDEVLISGVRSDQWAGPTPCLEYDVRTLVNHIVGWLQVFEAAANERASDLRKCVVSLS